MERRSKKLYENGEQTYRAKMRKSGKNWIIIGMLSTAILGGGGSAFFD